MAIKHACCFAVAELVASMDDREKYTDGEASVCGNDSSSLGRENMAG